VSEGSVVFQDKRQGRSEAHSLPLAAPHQTVMMTTHGVGPAQCTGVRHETSLLLQQLTKWGCGAS